MMARRARWWFLHLLVLAGGAGGCGATGAARPEPEESEPFRHGWSPGAFARCRRVSSWSPNLPVEPAVDGRQIAETSLVTAEGRVWLVYIDAIYRLTPNGFVAWPGQVVLRTSTDGGRTFPDRRIIGESAGDPWLAAGRPGVFAAFIDYTGRDAALALSALTGRPGVVHPLGPGGSFDADMASATVGPDGRLHLLAVDTSIGRRQPFTFPPVPTPLYAHSDDGGATFAPVQELAYVGRLPQIAVGHSALLVVGARGFQRSLDGGASFEPPVSRAFGDRLARAAASADGRRFHVVGDSVAEGLHLHTTADDGATWTESRVDAAPSAAAWRYPAIHVDPTGVVHVAWLDDRTGCGGVYHATSTDGGRTFSGESLVSDAPFLFPADAPPPPPATQTGSWIGDYISVTTHEGCPIVAWADQRAGHTMSTVYVATRCPPGRAERMGTPPSPSP